MEKMTWSVLKKIAVLTLGVPIAVIGIILIPLPGPGLLIMLLGLFILSLEFDWAKRDMDSVKKQLYKLTAGARKRLEDARNEGKPDKE